MSFVRVIARERKGLAWNDDVRLVVQCMIDQHQRLAPGEWFGYVTEGKSMFHPFKLRSGKTFCYGGEDSIEEPTTFGARTIAKGEQFTIRSDVRQPQEEQFEVTFQITDVTVIADGASAAA